MEITQTEYLTSVIYAEVVILTTSDSFEVMALQSFKAIKVIFKARSNPPTPKETTCTKM